MGAAGWLAAGECIRGPVSWCAPHHHLRVLLSSLVRSINLDIVPLYACDGLPGTAAAPAPAPAMARKLLA